MDFDPVDVQKHLKGANYPATGEQLAATAESNDARTTWSRSSGASATKTSAAPIRSGLPSNVHERALSTFT